jgi:NAD(P)-dependent dehydrogenase (short-subunit alcohol dehydrogenase family)
MSHDVAAEAARAMKLSLHGKTVLVTGGAAGLGRMIAEGMLGAGAKVIITSRKLASQAATQLGPNCIGINVDLGVSEGIDALARGVRDQTDRLHVIVNNAGKTWGAPFATFPDSAWNEVLALNLRAPFAVVQRLLPQLEAAVAPDDPARVIQIGSVAGVRVERLGAFSYAASKAALHHLSRELAAELAPRGITVNTVVPGYFPTKITAHIRSDEQRLDTLTRRIPLGRLGRPADIAGLCVYLASALGSYITGAEIAIDGGLSGCV